MESLNTAFNVSLPIFILMLIGYVLKILKVLDLHTIRVLNKIGFKLFLPVLLFNNIRSTNLESIGAMRTVVFAVVFIISMFIFLYIFIPIIEKDNRNRGVMIQGIFRSNFVLFAIPIITTILGKEHAGIASICVGFVVPLFNVLAVTAIETFGNGSVNIKKILIGIAKNPLIIASLAGAIALFLKIDFYTPINTVLDDITSIATPLALIALGADFSFNKVGGNLRNLIIVVVGKCVFVPIIGISIAIAMGFRGAELVTLLGVFVSPTAVSSYTMASQTNSNTDLAVQIVVFTSVVAIFTIFFTVFLLKQLAMF